jgi:hypothetical protein
MIQGVVEQTEDHIAGAQTVWFGLNPTHNQFVAEHTVVRFTVVLVLVYYGLSWLDGIEL